MTYLSWFLSLFVIFHKGPNTLPGCGHVEVQFTFWSRLRERIPHIKYNHGLRKSSLSDYTQSVDWISAFLYWNILFTFTLPFIVYKESKRTNFSVGAFSSDPCRTDSFLTSTHSYLSSTYCNSNLFLSTTALERECFTQRLQDNSNYNNDSLSTLRVPLQALELLPQTQKPFL